MPNTNTTIPARPGHLFLFKLPPLSRAGQAHPTPFDRFQGPIGDRQRDERQTPSPILQWIESLRSHLGRYRDRTLASYWAFCRHPRSSLRATIVSRVTEVAAGRKFALAA